MGLKFCLFALFLLFALLLFVLQCVKIHSAGIDSRRNSGGTSTGVNHGGGRHTPARPRTPRPRHRTQTQRPPRPRPYTPRPTGIQKTHKPGVESRNPGGNYHRKPVYNPYPGNQPPPYLVQHPPSYTQLKNYHPLPPNPATVVVVQGGGSSYGSRTTGDIFKEAIIHAGVNVAVNRLVNKDSFGHSYGRSYNRVSQSTVTSTNTHIVNNNNYGQPSKNGNSFSNGNNGGNGNNVNVQATPSWGVTDQELNNITEQLFNMDDNNGAKYIALNLQFLFTGNGTNITDASTGPLFIVDPAAYRIPTVKGIRSLYAAIAAVENKTQESSQHEETLFVDLVLNTNVMSVAMDFLSRKNLVKNDYHEHKDILNHIWFTPYEENSSGFKRVFNGELLGEGVFWGLQDWTAFHHQEKANNTNYLSYVNKVVLGKSPPERLILKANYDIRGARKAGAALFVGVSPELQMALYTICRFARPDNYCDVSLGGTNVKLFTHTFGYFGKDLIDAAFPVLD